MRNNNLNSLQKFLRPPRALCMISIVTTIMNSFRRSRARLFPWFFALLLGGASALHGVQAPVVDFESGYLTQWVVVGPFPQKTDEEKTRAWIPLPDGKTAFIPDFTATIASPLGKEGVVSWQAFDSPGATLEMMSPLGAHEFACGYGFTVLRSARARDAILEIAPDDRLELWLNGQRVGSWGIGVHEAPVHLEAGENTFLVKSVNDYGGWTFSLKVRSPLALSVPAFSPNGDGVNDTLQIRMYSPSRPAAGKVLRDGKVVKAALAFEKGRAAGTWQATWDGRDDRGHVVEPGDYEVIVFPNTPAQAQAKVKVVMDRRWNRSLAWERKYFPLGVFVDGNSVGNKLGPRPGMETMCQGLLEHGFDTVFFCNQILARDEPLLDIPDRLGIKVVAALSDLNQSWFAEGVPADELTAENAVRPLVEKLKEHPSVAGYYTADEPSLHLKDKLVTISRIIESLDPSRPSMACYVGIDRVEPLYAAVQSRVFLIDVYPCGYQNAPGDFTLTGFGYPDLDFVSYIRKVIRHKPPQVPLWIILQTHGFLKSLRAPSPAEVRLQTWLALAEGAQGLIYFSYHTQQGWIGLVDENLAPTPLYEEASRLVKRIAPHRDLLLGLIRNPTLSLQVSGFHVGVMKSPKTGKSYGIICNLDVLRDKALRLPPHITAQDPLSGKPFQNGILVPPGDGVLLQLSPR